MSLSVSHSLAICTCSITNCITISETDQKYLSLHFSGSEFPLLGLDSPAVHDSDRHISLPRKSLGSEMKCGEKTSNHEFMQNGDGDWN